MSISKGDVFVYRFNGLKFKSGERPGEIASTGPSMTDPSHKDSCDINNILAGYRRAGLALPVGDASLYGDFSKLPSFIDAQNMILRANEQFANLDSRVRKRFSNDPAEFLAFCNDPSNDAEMYTLGLKVKPVVADPQASGKVLPPTPIEKAPSSGGQPDKSTK